MAELRDDEIVPSLVIFLDPIAMSDDPRTETNVEFAPDGFDNSVRDGHYFLVLRKFDTWRWLLLPLFSDDSGGVRRPLTGTKSGYEDQWSEGTSFYSSWQHWLAPVSAILDADSAERSPEDGRRFYAISDKRELEQLALPIVKNRQAFHKPRPRPLVTTNSN